MNIHAPSDFWDGWPCGTWIYLPDGTRAQCDRCRQMASCGYWAVVGCHFCSKCFLRGNERSVK